MLKVNEILRREEELAKMVKFTSKSDFALGKFDSMFTYLDMLKRRIVDFNFIQEGMNLFIDFGKTEEQNFSITKIKTFLNSHGLSIQYNVVEEEVN